MLIAAVKQMLQVQISSLVAVARQVMRVTNMHFAQLLVADFVLDESWYSTATLASSGFQVAHVLLRTDCTHTQLHLHTTNTEHQLYTTLTGSRLIVPYHHRPHNACQPTILSENT